MADEKEALLGGEECYARRKRRLSTAKEVVHSGKRGYVRCTRRLCTAKKKVVYGREGEEDKITEKGAFEMERTPLFYTKAPV